MVRISVSVEGPTEEKFVKSCLYDYLINRNILITPVIVTTKRNMLTSEKEAKGGWVTVSRVVEEIKNLINNYDYVTTFHDFYGFQDKREDEDVDALQERIFVSLKEQMPNYDGNMLNKKVFVYIQMHEFEALLFSDIEKLSKRLNLSESKKNRLKSSVEIYTNPEAINDSPHTAPSKRIEDFYPNYIKTLGYEIVNDIGIDIIRNKCPRFNLWLTKIESLVG